MRNQIVVDFGDNYTSIFYWSNEDSLQKLKESIQKRFKIHPDHQTIKYGEIVLNEEYFKELHRKRFTENFKFDVQFENHDSYYLDIVGKQREDIRKENRACQVEMPKHRWNMDFKLNPEWTIAHLKQFIFKKKRKLKVDMMVLQTRKDSSVILSDEHILADLLLDLSNDKPLGLFLTMRQTELTERNYYDQLRPVQIIIPYWDRDLKLDYPLMEIGCLGISVLKSWFEAVFQVPYGEQLVVYQGDVVQNEQFPKHMVHRCHRLSHVQVKLNIFSTSKATLTSLYCRLKIKTLLPVEVSSFGASNYWQYHYRGEKGQSFDEFIEETLMIPKRKQRLFVNGRKVSTSDIVKNLLSEENREQTNKTDNHPENAEEENLTENLVTSLKVNLAVQVDDAEVELIEIIQLLGLSWVRSILIKHPHNEKVFCEFSLSQLEDVKEYTNIANTLRYFFAEKHKDVPPQYICLLHDQRLIAKATTNDVHDLMVQGNTIAEKLVLTLTIKPNLNENTKMFCEEHNLTFLKQVNINFLTGQFSIDVLSGRVNTLHDVKNEIFNTKGIAPHLQTLYHNNIEQADVGNKCAFMTRMMDRESVTLNLVVKPAEKIKLYIYANFLKEQIQTEILETATVLDLKEMISERSGISTAYLIVGGYIDKLDSEPIWKCQFKNNEVYVYKRVIIYVDNRGAVLRKDNFINDWKKETLLTLHKDIKRKYICFGNVAMIKTGLKSSTLLKDLGNQEVRFVVNPEKRSCNIM